MSRASALGLSAERIIEIVRRFAGQPVLIVGDVMLDRFIVGRVTRISPEAPVPIVRFQSEHLRLGGAANVAHNVVALGGRASLVGVIGSDAAGERLREQLAAVGIADDGLVRDPGRPTTEKVRVVTERNQQVARIDYERETDVAEDVESSIVERAVAAAQGARALVVSDYLKGAVTRPLIEVLLTASALCEELGTPVPLIVDPKIPHLMSYAGATLVTPNHHEAEVATHMRIRNDEEARVAALEFRYRAKCAGALITRGEHGMCLSAGGNPYGGDAEATIAANAREVSDVTGAGDTVIATLALALAAGATMTEAAILANQAAGVVVGKFGAATLTPRELVASFALNA